MKRRSVSCLKEFVISVRNAVVILQPRPGSARMSAMGRSCPTRLRARAARHAALGFACAGLLGSGLGLWLGGCAGPSETASPAGGERAERVRNAPLNVWFGDEGLEVRVWVVDPARQQPGAALLTYEPRPVDAPAEVLAAWRRAGVRVLSVPAIELEAVREKVRAIGASRQEWLGEQPRWGILASGVFVPRRLEFIGPDGHDFLENGNARLLIRTWTQTAEDEAGLPTTVVRVEVAAQIVTRASGISLQPVPWGEGEGRVLEAMTLRVRMREGDAMVFVADRPEVNWASLASGVGASAVGASASASEPEPQPSTPAGPGLEEAKPPVFVAPTFGELVFAGDPELRAGASSARVMLALVPHTRTVRSEK